MNFCIKDIPAQVVCEVVNSLVPNYRKDTSNLGEALETGGGNCFARMKLGGGSITVIRRW